MGRTIALSMRRQSSEAWARSLPSILALLPGAGINGRARPLHTAAVPPARLMYLDCAPQR